MMRTTRAAARAQQAAEEAALRAENDAAIPDAPESPAVHDHPSGVDDAPLEPPSPAAENEGASAAALEEGHIEDEPTKQTRGAHEKAAQDASAPEPEAEPQPEPGPDEAVPTEEADPAPAPKRTRSTRARKAKASEPDTAAEEETTAAEEDAPLAASEKETEAEEACAAGLEEIQPHDQELEHGLSESEPDLLAAPAESATPESETDEIADATNGRDTEPTPVGEDAVAAGASLSSSPELDPVEQQILEDIMNSTRKQPTAEDPASPDTAIAFPPLELTDPIDEMDELEAGSEAVQSNDPEARSGDDSLEDQSGPGEDVSSTSAKPKATRRPSTNVKPATRQASAAASTKAGAKPRMTRTATEPKVSTRSATAAAAAPASKPSRVRSASARTAPAKEDGSGDDEQRPPGKVVDYLAMKRRPVSMTFPAPPPPAKSSKQPTFPTFQLPGEAIAAKLKAQKEERLKREAGRAADEIRERAEKEVSERKKREFKARPLPSFIKNPGASAQVRQTAASRAREGLMHGGADAPDGGIEAKRQRPLPTRPAPAQRSSSTSQCSNASSVSSTTAAALEIAANSPAAKSRPRITSAPSSGGAAAFRPGPVTKSEVTTADKQALKQKAKAIFNRDKVEKERLEQEKRDKEEAAKQARAAAAERGRLASREWAEKMKMKKMEAKAGATKSAVA